MFYSHEKTVYYEKLPRPSSQVLKAQDIFQSYVKIGVWFLFLII